MTSGIDPMFSTRASLRDSLAVALPEGFHCKVRYVHTPSKRCDPLFSAGPGQSVENTRLASHFLTFSVADRSSFGKESTSVDAMAYGVEALVYTTKRLTTIFVSKADSTGYVSRSQPSPVKTITTTFLRWLSDEQRRRYPHRELVISLFARSQSQYLFPGSAENAKKHVLDDRQLVKWWARVLDPLIPSTFTNGTSRHDGYITIPGFEGHDLHPFFPSSSSTSRPQWHAGDPLLQLAKTRGVPIDAPPRCVLPRFPDDPKARFIQDLDGEAGIPEETAAITSPAKRTAGRWSSVRDLRTFWETMAFRQECSSGRLVGFIWLVMRSESGGKVRAPVENEQSASQDSVLSGRSNDSIPETAGSPTERSYKNASPRRKPLSGPIVSRQPRLKGGSSSIVRSGLSGTTDVDTSNGLILSTEGYDRVMQTLLHLDFANIEVAAQSTNKWIAEVSLTGGVSSDWAWNVEGKAKALTPDAKTVNEGAQPVNDLGSMIRKKRKAEDVVSESKAEPIVNVLGGGMVRKKSKPAPSEDLRCRVPRGR